LRPLLLSPASLLHTLPVQFLSSYLNQSGCYEVNGVNDARDYTEVRHAMDVIGMTQDEQIEVFRMVGSILHIGNLEFKADAKGAAAVDNTQILDIAARVLRVTPDALKKALTTKTITTRTESIGSPLSAEEASYSRDSLAKTLYDFSLDCDLTLSSPSLPPFFFFLSGTESSLTGLCCARTT